MLYLIKNDFLMRDMIVNLDLIVYIMFICMFGVFNLYLCFYVFIKCYYYSNIVYLFIFYIGFIVIYCMGVVFSLLFVNFEEMKFWIVV